MKKLANLVEFVKNVSMWANVGFRALLLTIMKLDKWTLNFQCSTRYSLQKQYLNPCHCFLEVYLTSINSTHFSTNAIIKFCMVSHSLLTLVSLKNLSNGGALG